jgi:cytoskeletal protein CcmA (bactofilin family)
LFNREQKTEAKPNRIDSLIGVGTQIEGDIIFTGGLRVEGEIKGNIRLGGDDSGVLMVGAQAVVTGDVHVTHLVVDGTIHGSVHAAQTIEMRPTAKIVGDIHYRTIEIQLGAIIQGQMINAQASSNE